MALRISRGAVQSENLEFLRHFVQTKNPVAVDAIDRIIREDARGEAQEHYRLLAYLSRQFNGGLILDMGTAFGGSALSLAQNSRNRVVSYDVEMRVGSVMDEEKIRGQVPNLKFETKSCLQATPSIIRKADLILLDIDPHNGVVESVFVNMIRDYGFSGYLVMDDINPMRYPSLGRLYLELPEQKYDLTSIGHFSGTGLVCFNDQHVEIVD